MTNKNNNHYPIPMIILSTIIAVALFMTVVNYFQNRALSKDIQILSAQIQLLKSE